MNIQDALPSIVVVVVLGFFLGNIFAAKPRAHDVLVADFRLLARRFGFNPKFISPPSWLPSHKTDKLITMYAIVHDKWRLPLMRFVAIDDAWQALDGEAVLAGVKIDLPDDIKNHAIGLQAKANSVIFYWQDERYQSHQGLVKLNQSLAEQDLTALKNSLMAWGDLLNQIKPTK